MLQLQSQTHFVTAGAAAAAAADAAADDEAGMVAEWHRDLVSVGV